MARSMDIRGRSVTDRYLRFAMVDEHTGVRQGGGGR